MNYYEDTQNEFKERENDEETKMEMKSSLKNLQTIQTEDGESSSDDDQSEDMDKLSLKPQKNQFPGLVKLRIFVNISPHDFIEIKKQFNILNNMVDVNQFVLIFMEVLTGKTTLDEQVYEYIQALVELYQMIDLFSQKFISFDQLSDFLVKMHEILGRDQNLFEVRLKSRLPGPPMDNAPVEKLFSLDGYHGFAYLELSQKIIKLVSPQTWDDQLSVSIGQTTIICACFLPKQNSLVLASNDKFLSFFDLKTLKLIRRFQAPDVQLYLEVSRKKGIIYGASVNGIIYSWSVEKIFSKEFFNSSMKHPDCFKLALHVNPMYYNKNLSPLNYIYEGLNQKVGEKYMGAFLLIETLDTIATGSSDSVIRLFENKKKLTSKHKQLRGHQKSIKALTYCNQYKYLISCSYDFEVLIWNIYLDHALAKLPGHEAPLVSVLTLSEKYPNRFSLILSCDAKGILKVWDPKTFQCIQQIIVTDGEQRVKSMVYKKESCMVLMANKKLQIFEVDQTYEQNLSDDAPISSFCYSKKYLEIHVATAKQIKSWDLQNGVIKRVLKEINDGDITTLTLDDTERRVFAGIHNGKIIVIDIFTGFQVRVISDFTKEICHLSYSAEFKLLIGVCWDRQVRVFNDHNFSDKKQEKDISLRIIKNAHSTEILGGAFSENLMLIATSNKEGEIHLWDFEKGHFISRLRTTMKEIIALKFLDPYPLLLSSDITGTLTIHIVRPHEQEGETAIVWKNMFTTLKATQVTAVEHLSELITVLGDENGDIRLISFKEVLQKLKITSAQISSNNKNLHRFFQMTFNNYDTEGISKVAIFQGLVNEKHARQLTSWKAHKNGIKIMKVIKETLEPSLITMAQDRLIKIWNAQNGQMLGAFRQGQQQNPFVLELKPGYVRMDKEIYESVIKDYNNNRDKRDIIRKTQQGIIKRTQKDDESQLIHVESKDIFKNLQEINKYLDMRGKQQDTKNRSSYK